MQAPGRRPLRGGAPLERRERPARARPRRRGSPGPIPNPAVKPAIAESTAAPGCGRPGRRARAGRFCILRERREAAFGRPFLFPASPARTAARRPIRPPHPPPPPLRGAFLLSGPEPMRRCAYRERSRVYCVLSFSLPCFVLVCAFSYASNPILGSIPSCRNPGFGWPNIHFKHHAASCQAPCGISLFDWSWGNVSQAAILRCDFDLPGAIHDA